MLSFHCEQIDFANGHIMLKTPVRSPNFLHMGFRQYLDGWPPGNTGCCWLSFYSANTDLIRQAKVWSYPWNKQTVESVEYILPVAWPAHDEQTSNHAKVLFSWSCIIVCTLEWLLFLGSNLSARHRITICYSVAEGTVVVPIYQSFLIESEINWWVFYLFMSNKI